MQILDDWTCSISIRHEEVIKFKGKEMKSAEEFSGDTSQRRTSGEHGIKFIEYEVSEMNQVQVRPRQLDEMSANEASTPANVSMY